MEFTWVSEASAQTLNEYRKCIALHYDEYPLTLTTYPMAPLNLPVRETWHRATFESVQNFVQRFKARVVRQEPDSLHVGKVKGVWIHHQQLFLAPVYIELEPDGVALRPHVPRSAPMNHPLSHSLEGTSVLEQWTHAKDVSEILKEYAVYTYATSQERSPGSFTRDNSFTVIPTHTYAIDELHGRLLPDTPVMYDGYRLIVLTEEMADRLYDYVMTLVQYHEGEVMAYTLRHYYRYTPLSQAISPTPSPSISPSHVFANWETLSTHLQQRDENYVLPVHMTLPPKQEEVIVYGESMVAKRRVVLANGKARTLGICWVQYVASDDLHDAHYVTIQWDQTHLNLGYYARNPQPLLVRVLMEEYTLYIYRHYMKQWTVRRKTQERKTKKAYMLEYAPGKYAALLTMHSVNYTSLDIKEVPPSTDC